MERNVGRYDRAIRIVGGVVLVFAALAPFAGFLPVRLGALPWLALPALALLVGVLLLLTGATGRSIVYSVFGFETYTPENEGRSPDERR